MWSESAGNRRRGKERKAKVEAGNEQRKKWIKRMMIEMKGYFGFRAISRPNERVKRRKRRKKSLAVDVEAITIEPLRSRAILARKAKEGEQGLVKVKQGQRWDSVLKRAAKSCTNCFGKTTNADRVDK
jgi:choline dehydrogenase-like flavoprotein